MSMHSGVSTTVAMKVKPMPISTVVPIENNTG